MVFLRGSFSHKAGTFGVNEYILVCLSAQKLMGIVEKMSSSFLNMDSSEGRGVGREDSPGLVVSRSY